MDSDRKYRQPGYQDSGSASSSHPADPRERFTTPRHPLDITAPRTPRMVQHVTASRCYDCSTSLPPGFNFLEPCPKCAAELHCCKQCQNFEPSAHFQCTKPINERVASKDKRNDCTLFAPLVTVARDSAPPPAHIAGPPPAAPKHDNTPRSVSDARAAFENLFKK